MLFFLSFRIARLFVNGNFENIVQIQNDKILDLCGQAKLGVKQWCTIKHRKQQTNVMYRSLSYFVEYINHKAIWRASFLYTF